MDCPKHGSPADRGSADAYYGRNYDPHYWPLGTYVGDRVEMKDMTPDEIVLYSTAYRDQDPGQKGLVMRFIVGIIILWALIYNDAQLFKALHGFLIALVGG